MDEIAVEPAGQYFAICVKNKIVVSAMRHLLPSKTVHYIHFKYEAKTLHIPVIMKHKADHKLCGLP